MIHQAASICQNMLLLFPHDHHDGSSSYDQEYTQPPPSPDDSDSDFQIALTFLGGIPRPYLEGCVCANLNLMDFNPLRQQLHHFLLKTIETSSQTKLIETRKVSPHNLIHFVKWAWRSSNNNKDLITTPVLESLVSAVRDCSTDIYVDVHLRKNDILFLWDLLKHIGHCQTGLLNTQILNQLLYHDQFIFDHGKTTLEVFHKFEIFQCVPNRDTYTLTLEALLSTRLIMSHQAASICQKMLLHPETLLLDDGLVLIALISWFARNNMTKEAYALYLAAKEKPKTNPNWPLWIDRSFLLETIKVLCSKKETVHLAFEMFNDIPEMVEHRDLCFKNKMFKLVVEGLCWFKEFDAVKQLILKIVVDSEEHLLIFAINTLIRAFVKAGEIIQALEMVMLLESIGFYICNSLMFRGMLQIKKILKEAKKKDYKLITALPYHTLIVGYCKLTKFDIALKLLTQMKDFGFSDTSLDEYHKLIHPICLMAMDGKIAIKQLEEMEPMDWEMVKDQLGKMAIMDLDMIEEKLEEMYLNIRALF
jgi:pentatricopeptide repeat protein